MKVAGRIAVVTGGGHGMGRELVRQLAAAGCHVAACDVSSDALAETAELAEQDGVRVSTHLVDVSVETDWLRFADEVRRDHETDHVNLLFNNAGIGGGGSMFTDSREAWERTFNIDWGGVYLGVRTFLPLLVAADKAKIVNTSSVNGFWATIGMRQPHTSYSAAKFAVKGFTEALMNDLRINAPHVTAAVVMPGHIGTDILANTTRLLTGATTEELDPKTVAQAKRFADDAPVTAAEAAAVILDGVRQDRWRILIGDDAHTIDRLVREDPENAYTQEFFTDLTLQVGWRLGTS